MADIVKQVFDAMTLVGPEMSLDDCDRVAEALYDAGSHIKSLHGALKQIAGFRPIRPEIAAIANNALKAVSDD